MSSAKTIAEELMRLRFRKSSGQLEQTFRLLIIRKISPGGLHSSRFSGVLHNSQVMMIGGDTDSPLFCCINMVNFIYPIME